jgi:hypothetical protein
MVNQSSEYGLGRSEGFWGVVIGVLIATLTVVEMELEQKGLIPSWVFGWISTDPQTRKFEFSILLCGGVGLWFLVSIAKQGAFKNIMKICLNPILSAFPFLRPKARSRR